MNTEAGAKEIVAPGISQKRPKPARVTGKKPQAQAQRPKRKTQKKKKAKATVTAVKAKEDIAPWE